MQGRAQRREARVATTLPVRIEGAAGLTRDVSVSGIFFEVDTALQAGNDIDFSVDMATPTGKLVMRCHGSIVRVVPGKGRMGVAVRITDQVIEAEK